MADMNNLKNLRKKARKTLQEIARETGASISLISKFERGERTMNEKWKQRIASALAVPASEIVGENVKSVPSPPGVPDFLTLEALQVYSSEMDRQIPAGSTVFVERTDEITDRAIYVLEVEGNFHLRRARLTSGPVRFEADSWSGSHDPIFMGAAFRVIGRVRGATRELP